jgi:hypothetical protein
MGLFDSVGKALGLSGSGSSGKKARRQMQKEANALRNFTPIRVRSLAGTGTYSKEGMDFDLDPALAAGARSAMDFFGGSASRLAAFDEGDATARTLALLRERRAPMFESQLGRLESRLMGQGRLGLSTGARAENPELASFFSSEATADLEAQIAAGAEARNERASLLQATQGGLGLAMEAAMPSTMMQGLFNVESLRSARDLAAANIAVGGIKAQQAGAERDLDARAGFFGNITKGLF